MSVRDAHGLNPIEINKYDAIDEIDVLSIAIYHCSLHSEPLLAFEHKHEECEFMIPITTVHLWKHDNFKVIGEFGFVYPANSNVVHGFDHDLNKSNFISITIDYEFIKARAKALGYKNIYLGNKFEVNSLLYQLIKDFQNHAREEFPNREHLRDIATELTNELLELGHNAGPKRNIPVRAYDPSIRKVLSYMFLNFRNPDIDLTNLANYCGYSVAYFSRVFKQYVGDSPITHLNKLRISEARSLFYNRNLSLSEISELVGFKNLSTFTEAFKKLSGDKPKQYRSKHYKNKE